jgi:hypothetical protein
MRSVVTLVVVVLLLVGCNVSVADFGAEAELAAAGGVTPIFRAQLSPEEEVHAVVSLASGHAILTLSADGTQLRYRVIVAAIEDVTMAHIHLAPAGLNGPVVAWLYPDAPPAALIEGRSQGLLAHGVLTAADLRGPLAGQPLSALVAALRGGNAYVNVHTSTYTAGEIRGQIR